MSTELALPATLHKIGAVSLRTGLSRSALYREIRNPKNVHGEVRVNEQGRLRVVHVGRSIRVREQDLIEFLNSLGE